MKTIEKYIQFAIDNGYKSPVSKEIIGYTMFCRICLTKDFIEAIARGEKKLERGRAKENGMLIAEVASVGHQRAYMQQRIDRITTEQVFAIRDGKIEVFINNLLIGAQ